MALEAYAGTLLNPTSAGDQAITDPGFTPKLLLFMGCGLNVDTTADHASHMFGFATASTEEGCYQAITQNGSSWNKRSHHTNADCIDVRNVTGGNFVDANLKTLDANGFTLTWDTTSAFQRDFPYLALGGDDLTDAEVIEFTTNTSTGSQEESGMSFQPDALILVCTGITSAARATQDDDTSYCIGFAAGAIVRCCGGASEDSTDGYEYSRYSQSAVMSLIDHDGTPLFEASLTSLDSDGFTLNVTTADGNAYRCYAIGIKCTESTQVAVRDDTTPTSTETFSLSLTNYSPKAGFFVSSQQTAVGGTADRYLSLGFASDVNGSEHYSLWGGAEDSPTSSNVADRVFESDRMLSLWAEGTPTALAEAEVDSFDSEGLTFELLTADGSEYLFMMMLFADPAASGVVDPLLKKEMLGKNLMGGLLN